MKSNIEKKKNIFIENVNSYVNANKIRQAYVSMITGIEPSKLSRLMTGTQDTSFHDMELIANALGKKIDFFLQESQMADSNEEEIIGQYAFYAGMPGKRQQAVAEELIALIRNADEILGAEARLALLAGE